MTFYFYYPKCLFTFVSSKIKKLKNMATNEDLKKRVLDAKSSLPSSGVSSLFFRYYKDVKKTQKNRTKLNNILQLRSCDQDFTEKIEGLVKLLDSYKSEKSI
ncbi:hypothetical protein Phi18:2_gp10 [Cellulophaga phage phi18:2]|uniref:Uncharacterized protein n=2 Tax=Cellulophaga phage phi18:1 TaxID=1327982 RepID=S0A4K2_9CAUD|nr:hypothetical protein Phi18:1_gp10 [Cellulophaga phage phi18:1]AGO48457.1 hypothetical protein Phi18:1_gp10 [Cellulophaga phage phi18:1]AGO49173.1 hypothetical protein Phi18:2_gp10 [Cellulophaga phage phi18:2]